MEKEPKFRVGEWVVFRRGGLKEITQIEDVAKVGGEYYYQVEGRVQAVPEDRLEKYEEGADGMQYDDDFDVELRFAIGDIVQVEGYAGQYRVEAVSVTSHITAEGTSHEVIYQLRGDSGMISAVDEDMALIEECDDPIIEFVPEGRKALTEEERVDALLGELFDYMTLRDHFGDKEYRDECERIKIVLDNFTNRKND